jgi:glutaminase
MSTRLNPSKTRPEAYVSTGHLPPPEQVKALVVEAHQRFKSDKAGKNSQVYPALAKVPSNLFGICVVGTNGNVHAVGDSEHEFTIMSVSKPFLFALVCQEVGVEAARQKIGVNATGRAFNSLEGIERNPDGRTNPMVNSGAIATTSLVPGATSRPSGNSSTTDCPGSPAGNCRSTKRCTSPRRRPTTATRASPGCFRVTRIYMDPAEAVDLYTKQCALNVSARDLAVMGATLADGGVNPITRERVVDASVCHYALAVMTTAGLYETSGDWLFDIGLPGKSGIGGGIVTVSPGKGGLGRLPRRSTARATV